MAVSATYIVDICYFGFILKPDIPGQRHAPETQHSVPHPSLPLLSHFFGSTKGNIMKDNSPRRGGKRTSGMKGCVTRVVRNCAVCNVKRIENWCHGKGVGPIGS